MARMAGEALAKKTELAARVIHVKEPILTKDFIKN